MSLFGLDEEVIKKAKAKYTEQVREELKEDSSLTAVQKAKEVVKRVRDFFSEETEELRRWLVKNHFLPEPKVSDDEMTQIPTKVLQNILHKLEEAQNLIKELKEELGKYTNQETKPKKESMEREKNKQRYIQNLKKQYGEGEEAANDDWNNLTEKEQEAIYNGQF